MVNLPLLLLCAIFVSSYNTADIDYQLIRTTITTSTLQNLYDQNVDVWRSERMGTDLWQVDYLCEKPCNLSPPQITILDPSIAQTIENERIEIEAARKLSPFNASSSADEFFDAFRPYSEWQSFFLRLVESYPNFVEQFTVGTTVEGREIIGFTITAPTTPPREKPGIHLQALQHAREWLAPTTLMFVVVNMLENYETDETAQLLLDNIEWTVIPIVNVDGYLFSWSSTRLWRKNRRPNADGTRGVDLNRNWGPASTWCTSGSSTVPSSDTYCGTAPFSEPEARFVAELLNSKRGQVKGGIDFHTYGPLLLWPWQYTYNQLPGGDYQMYLNLGKAIETSINAVHSQSYISQQGSDLYPHSGGFIDYNWSQNGIIAFTLEGRGPSFVAPVSAIVPAGEEAYEGVVELVKYILSKSK